MRSGARFARTVLVAAGLCLAGAGAGHAQVSGPQSEAAATVARDRSGPTFTINEQVLHSPPTVVAYGDIRFTDPANVTATNPTARRAIILRILAEKPDALLLNGDVPWHGGDRGDYDVYQKGNPSLARCEFAYLPGTGEPRVCRVRSAAMPGELVGGFPKAEGPAVVLRELRSEDLHNGAG